MVDAMNGVGVTTGIVPSENWRRGVRAAAPAVVAALACAGALLCVRRALTAVSGDLPWGDSAATAVMSAAVIAAAREAWRRSGGVEDQRSSFPAHVLTWGATLASSLLFLGCCAPTFRTSLQTELLKGSVQTSFA